MMIYSKAHPLIVGYSKMVSVFNGSSDRARIITAHVSRYNMLVESLERSVRPTWLSGSLRHAKMDVEELLCMDPSDEQWTKMWESLWNSHWSLDETPPAFIVDQQVRCGIAAVLSLARIAEEKVRLSREELNARTWIVQSVNSLIQIMDSIHRMLCKSH
jgi:hypothetical protein